MRMSNPGVSVERNYWLQAINYCLQKDHYVWTIFSPLMSVSFPITMPGILPVEIGSQKPVWGTMGVGGGQPIQIRRSSLPQKLFRGSR